MKYFDDNELKCKCGCGMDCTKELKDRLDKARELAGVPFLITSPARCPKHNKAVGGAPNSFHQKGIAIDIKYQNGYIGYKILKALFDAGFTGIGINYKKQFIHGDLRPGEPMIFPY